jgi:hypothetical protein
VCRKQLCVLDAVFRTLERVIDENTNETKLGNKEINRDQTFTVVRSSLHSHELNQRISRSIACCTNDVKGSEFKIITNRVKITSTRAEIGAVRPRAPGLELSYFQKGTINDFLIIPAKLRSYQCVSTTQNPKNQIRLRIL